jgi:hypothetical protein
MQPGAIVRYWPIVHIGFSLANVMRLLRTVHGDAPSYSVDINVILEFRQLQR